MEFPRALDPTECKHAIRHLKGTDNPQINSFDHGNAFTFFDDIQKCASLKQNNLFLYY